MGEGLVGFGHLLEIVLALDRCADAVGGVEELVGEALGHRALTTLARVAHEPTDGERVGTTRANLDGHLVRRATDAPAADLELILEASESIWTESSYKYTPRQLRDMLGRAGFGIAAQWEHDGFALTLGSAQ